MERCRPAGRIATAGARSAWGGRGLTIAASSHLQVGGYAAHGHGVVGATPRNAVLVVSYPPAGGGAVPPLSTESRSGQYTVAAAWRIWRRWSW